MQSASGSYRNLAGLADGFGSDALTEGKLTSTRCNVVELMELCLQEHVQFACMLSGFFVAV